MVGRISDDPAPTAADWFRALIPVFAACENGFRILASVCEDPTDPPDWSMERAMLGNVAAWLDAHPDVDEQLGTIMQITVEMDCPT